MDRFWERYIQSRPAPGESKGAFDAFAAEHRDPGPRNMYAGGQLVQNTADGSRPGYAENKYYTKTDPYHGKGAYIRPAHMKRYENIMKEYEKYLQKELKTGNMSETKLLKSFLLDQGKKGIQKHDFLNNMLTHSDKDPFVGSRSLLIHFELFQEFV